MSAMNNLLNNDGVLSNRKCMLSDRLTIPPRNAGKAMSDIIDLDVLRGGVEEIEAAWSES